MNPLRKIADTDENKIHRLIILVECLIVYIVVASAVGIWVIFGLVDQSHHKADNVGEGLAIIACNAGLARENSVLDHTPIIPGDQKAIAEVRSNITAAQGYFGLMPAFNLKYPGKPRDRFGEKCPFPELTKRATLLSKNLK